MAFIFVDRIVEMEPGQSILAIKKIKNDEDIFEVHYPGFPVVPGSFLIEMMAQATGKSLDAEKKDRGMAMLAKIKSASFRKYVGPGQTAVIKGKILTNRDRFATASSYIEVNREMVCKAELFFTFIPFQQLAPDFRDEVLETYLLGKTSNQTQKE